jgi:L-arabonate dehydrase
MVRVSGARMSGTTYGTVVRHVCPEAAVGGSPVNSMQGGYQQLYVERVMQANSGADLDFLIGCRGAEIPRESH